MSIGTLNMYDNSDIIDNSATGDGGGVYAESSADIYLYDTSRIGGTSANRGNEASNGAGAYLTGSGTTLNMYSGTRVGYNVASINGGGVAVVAGATLLVDGGSVTNNAAGDFGYGGGIYLDTNDVASTVTIQDDAYITDNTANLGGGIYIIDDNGTVNVFNSEVDNNSADFGGGIRINGDSIVLLTNARIRNNAAISGSGGGVALASGTYNATDTDMRGNTATNDGGGIYNNGGTVSLTSASSTSWVDGNSAVNGGGIYDSSGNTLRIEAQGGQLFVMNHNTATGDGGAVYATGDTYFWPRGSFTASSNSAVNGGFMYADSATAFIDDLATARPIITQNEATTGNGGGIYVVNSTDFTLNGVDLGTDLNGNTATSGNGGGMYIDNSIVRVITTRVQNNVAQQNGGGLYASNGSSVTVETSFTTPTSVLSTACNPKLLAADRYCSELRNNSAGLNLGGAIYLDNATFTSEYAAYSENDALTGSAIYSNNINDQVILVSNLFTGNVNPSGFVVRLWREAVLDADNNTLAENTGGAIGILLGGATVTADNNIVWGNTTASASAASINGACNNDQDGLMPGINLDPMFVTTPRGSYRLDTASPSLDTCNSGVARDLDNVARAKDGDMAPSAAEFDMGAFEHDPDAVATAVSLSSAETHISTPLHLIVLVMAVGLSLISLMVRRRVVRQGT